MSIVGFIVFAIISIVLSELLRPKPNFEDARPATLSDFKFPTAIEGRIVPIVWGTVKIEGPNVIWWGDLRQIPIKEKVKTGLWTKERVIRGFEYNIGFQVGLCRGLVGALRKVWIGDTVVFDGTVSDGGTVEIDDRNLFGGNKLGNGGIAGTLRFHAGSETQTPNVYLDDFQVPQPGYRGTCHLVWEGGYVGNSTNIKPWGFEVERFPNTLGLTGGKEIVNGVDANPAAVLFEILTDTDYGFGFPSSDVNTANFITAADTLFTEGNGFSMILDKARTANELLEEVERQIDGLILQNQRTGLYEIRLMRFDYDINTIPEITLANTKEVKDFSRGTWEETSNQVRIQFSDRARDYFETFAQAHDLANQRIQGGELISVIAKYPGVKDKTLANSIASRELLQLSLPLSKATIVVDRTFWDVQPGSVVAWTDAELGFAKLAMRVLRVDLGELLDNRITLSLAQDIFQFESPFFGEPDIGLWTPPDTQVTGIPAVDQSIFEAPHAITRRDPEFPGVIDRVWTGARDAVGNATSYQIFQRNASGTPSGSFVADGTVFGFFLIGSIRTALDGGEAQPTDGVEVDPIPDAVLEMQQAFTASPGASDIGQNLVNLILIENEFMAPTSVVNQTTHLELNGTFRGLLDSVPAPHAIGAKVFLLFIAGGLSDSVIPRGNNVDIQLRPESFNDIATEGESITISLTMDDRARRPYPPAELELNGTRFDDPVNFDTLQPGGSTLDDRGIDLTYVRKDFRTFDEVSGVLTDAATLDPTFPVANTTEYKGKIIDDPGGSPTDLFETAFADTDQIFLSRTKILRATVGVIPTDLRVEVFTRHTFESEVLEAQQKLFWDFLLAASTLDDDTNLANLAQSVISGTYTAPVTGTYTFTIGTALPTGIVEARINGGTFVTVIAAAATTGTLAGVVATDTIEVRHNDGGTVETFLEIDAPGSTLDAYAILI